MPTARNVPGYGLWEAPGKVMPPQEVAACSRLAAFLSKKPRLAQTFPALPGNQRNFLHLVPLPPRPCQVFLEFLESPGVAQCFPKGHLRFLALAFCQFSPPSPHCFLSSCLLGAISQPGGVHCVPSPLWVNSGAFELEKLCSPISLSAARFPPIPFLLMFSGTGVYLWICIFLLKIHMDIILEYDSSDFHIKPC